MADVLVPPVSASNHRVYFRDGAKKIRYLTPDGSREMRRPCPVWPKVRLVSASPDDQRIAVVVEEASNPSTITLRLYVQD